MEHQINSGTKLMENLLQCFIHRYKVIHLTTHLTRSSNKRLQITLTDIHSELNVKPSFTCFKHILIHLLYNVYVLFRIVSYYIPKILVPESLNCQSMLVYSLFNLIYLTSLKLTRAKSIFVFKCVALCLCEYRQLL